MKLPILLGLLSACTAFGQGPVLPEPLIEAGGEGSFEVNWHGEDDHVYFLQFSDNLSDWFYCPDIREGFDESIAYGFWSNSPALFLRVQTTNQSYSNPVLEDFDSDGIANWVEVELLSSDPLNADSDGDTIGDAAEDTDGDGILDVNEALWGVSSHYLADTDGDGLDDATELALGLNPLIADTDFDGTGDATDNLGLVANGTVPTDPTPSAGPTITILTPGVTLLP
ncbi:hypothetical protein HAHE_25230 [Haloferula helveola]|uniref:Uncharacterized protein n=1 Tax=Haloferula helveola TaxID=490095 RepID=A0ABM7REV6_9BACT|nr:hypothetical protein HAHE_25230 [Haloferula helveola]